MGVRSPGDSEQSSNEERLETGKGQMPRDGNHINNNNQAALLLNPMF